MEPKGYRMERANWHSSTVDPIPITGYQKLPVFLLPKEIEEVRFLKNGEQFLCFGSQSPRKYGYFGGVDDGHPFVSRMTSRVPYKAFEQEGEQAFYESLIPSLVTEWSERTHQPFGRQGDWYYCKIKKITFKSFFRLLGLIFREPWEEFWSSYFFWWRRSGFLGHTRHRVDGIAIHLFGRSVVIARGILEAPDHPPVLLKKWHILARTPHLRPD